MTMAASTSNAAHSNNNSCYDVFISHSGKDVKKTFASHLYYRLVSFGLRVFLDYQELQKGEDFPCEIKGAIKNASVHIAVFSPTYAASQWCLDELVLMLETRAPIIPVFYHVEPTELRRSHGEGVYATSLRNLEKKRKRDSDQPRYDSRTIENWRNALSRVADISGFVLDLGFKGDEGELLDQLVEVVLKKGKKKLNVAKYPTGLDDLVEDFETKLLLQQHGERVQFVGIIGLGGAGKTTLAKELFNRKSSEYSKSYFLFDVREEAKNSITSLQTKLLKGLSASKEKIDSKDEGIEILRRHFSLLSAPVLLVLDDVDHQDQVDALLPVTEGILTLPPSSLILITSRDTNVLTRSGVQKPSIYKLTGLSRERSRELFCSHAFCQPHPLSGFEPLVDQFLEACSGLPLSLKVFGGLLYGNTDKSYWKEQLNKLKKTLHKDIQKSLQVSYDALDKEEQQIFLDIACFFIGKSRDTAIRVWDGSGLNGKFWFESLLSKCLVEMGIGETDKSESPSHNTYFIRMHDHLRDMGRDLAKTSGFPCRLWRGTKHIEDLLQLSSEATKVRGIRMFQWEQYYERVYSDDESGYSDERPSFSRYKMKNLQLLDIDIGEDDLKCLLEAVDSPNLLWFSWVDCPCSSLPSYIPMENLRVLDVGGRELETLWQEDVQVPLQLRELYIDAPLSEVPESIGKLNRLEKIVLKNSVFETLPNVFSQMHCLKCIRLNRCREMMLLPDSVGQLTGLREFSLWDCSSLQGLPDSVAQLTALQSINLKYCDNLQGLPDSVGQLTGLQTLDLSNCSRLQGLPDSVGQLTGLQTLDLSNCSSLQGLPDSVGQLTDLQSINLGGWFSLKELPDWLAQLTGLQSLDLEGCYSLQRLPDSFGDLANLQNIYLNGCSSLQRLPDSVGNLWNLQCIDLRGCSGLHLLPNSFRNLKNLRYVDLSKCSNLEMLPYSFGNLRNLQYINLSKCSNLQMLPNSLQNLKQLQYMDLSWCSNLQTLPNSVGNLRNLRHIDLSWCSNLQLLPNSFGNLTNLQHINLSGCSNLPILPNSFGNLIQLKLLCLRKCYELTISSETLGQIRTLEWLEISGCFRIEVLPPQITNQRFLREMYLFCPFLKELPSTIGELSHLEILHLESSCVELLEMGELVSLEELQVRECVNLKSIQGLAQLRKLRRLDVANCSGLKELSGVEHLRSLEKLNASGCPNLQWGWGVREQLDKQLKDCIIK